MRIKRIYLRDREGDIIPLLGEDGKPVLNERGRPILPAPIDVVIEDAGPEQLMLDDTLIARGKSEGWIEEKNGRVLVKGKQGDVRGQPLEIEVGKVITPK